MCIITNFKDKVKQVKGKIIDGVKEKVLEAADKVSDSVAELSQFSPSQVAEIEEKRQAYLERKPDMESEEVQTLLKRNLDALGIEVYQTYIPQLNNIYVPIASDQTFDPQKRIRCFDITRWVTDAEENSLDKLVNVYHVLSGEECNIALIYHRDSEKCTVTLAVVNNREDTDSAATNEFGKRIIGAIKGNFPGTVLSLGDDSTIIPDNCGTPECLLESKLFEPENNGNDVKKAKTVAAISNLASEKSEKFISQSMEKLLDGIVPPEGEEYTLILLATPIKEQLERKNRLYELYTALSPYEAWQTSFHFTQSDNIGSSAMIGVNLGANAGASAGASATAGVSNSTGTAESSSKTKGSTTGGSIGGGWGPVSADVHHDESRSETKGTEISSGKSVDVHGGAHAEAHAGVSAGLSFNRTSSVNVQLTGSEGITQNHKNYGISHALEIIKAQMERLEQSSALGMWDFAAYVISDDQNIANNVAHMYLALTQGEKSYLAQSAVNLWHGSEQKEECVPILRELSRLRHPVFRLKAEDISDDNDLLLYPVAVDATTTISGKELAYSLNFPKKSVAGLPVIECAEFGRNISTYDEPKDSVDLPLGRIFHMNHTESTDVRLSKNSLASHTFITGSTGSGKSNTVYQILSEAVKSGAKFLVVEPAKGEYKYVFGSDRSVSVFGTNPNKTPLLRLDPFSFPDDIHVLEHLDRLVEIFNVCWPMYAAMPAVLKSAVEKSYEDCGWNLTESTNEFGSDLYPNFADVARNVKLIIDSSEYDNENKGAYKGALLTRLNSLTNGINGLIFTNDELSDKELFDENVIVDLSRVGSTETKSLIMGMLVLKLQEYRMTSGDMNADLKHITVLEEAHNLLKRTSAEQPIEGANLLGKSVEMIANAIAEMRTYGEGFIIADQAPGLLDMSTIRNTNTKIIMRLPDQADRELVGKAANLNENQIAELAKLPCGVGAVYQNEWVQPVLCKVEKFDQPAMQTYKYDRPAPIPQPDNSKTCLDIAELLSKGSAIGKEAILTDIMPKMRELRLGASIQAAIMKMLQMPPKEPRMTKLGPIMSALFPHVYKAVELSYNESHESEAWTISAKDMLIRDLQTEIDSKIRRDIVQAVITDYLYNHLGRVDELEEWTIEGGLKNV